MHCSLKYEDTICDGVYDLRGRFTDLQPGSPEQFPSLEELQMFIPGPLDDREVSLPLGIFPAVQIVRVLWRLHGSHAAAGVAKLPARRLPGKALAWQSLAGRMLCVLYLGGMLGCAQPS